ncbi:MAG TPA: MgtC/SapB family protein [Acidimicrobiia bacterium]
MPDELNVFEWTVRLATAALLSGLIGFEREAHHKAAGLRTHMLVGLGASLFTMLSAYAFGGEDTTRIAAQVVSGIGFLGAGAIFREGANVRGLTTAAGLWAVAAIGMTTGVGLVLGAVTATVLGLLILYGLGYAEKRLRSRDHLSRRPIGIRLANLGELDEIVSMAASLDPTSGPVELERYTDGTYLVMILVDTTRVATITAAAESFETVSEASEIDPM